MSVEEQAFQLLTGRFEHSPLSDSDAGEAVRRASQAEGIAPLIAFRIRGQASPELRQWCDSVLGESWRRHNRNYRALRKIGGLLADAGIPVLALKGPILAMRHYTPPFLRKPSCDLDLGVRCADLPEAVRILGGYGYRMTTSLTAAFGMSHHAVLEHDSGPRVELHFRLSHGVTGIPIDDCFDHSVLYAAPDGFTVRVLDPADEIMHLILHLVQDRFSTLFHLQEVHRIWSAGAADAREEAIRRAVSYRFSGVLALANAAFEARWGEPLIAAHLELPKTWLHWRINEKLYRRMRAGVMAVNERTLSGRLRGRWLDLQTTDGPGDALRKIISLTRVVRHELEKRRTEETDARAISP